LRAEGKVRLAGIAASRAGFRLLCSTARAKGKSGLDFTTALNAVHHR
jgi:hypothetical protein